MDRTEKKKTKQFLTIFVPPQMVKSHVWHNTYDEYCSYDRLKFKLYGVKYKNGHSK